MRFATHDGPGIRTTVFLKGCPLACTWCHNPESQSFRPDILYFADRCRHCGECIAACPEHAIEERDGKLRTGDTCKRCGHCLEFCMAEARQIAGRPCTVEELLREVERDLIFFEESGGGVTLSGGEPLSRPQFVSAFLRGCRDRGIPTAIETCGFAHPDVFLEVASLAGLVLFDLKLVDPEKHRRYTGVANSGILRNLEALARLRHPMKVRIPVVPGINDSADDAGAFARCLAPLGVPVELLPYHAIGAEKYRRLNRIYRLNGTPEPAPADLARFRNRLMFAGVNVEAGGST